MDNSTLIAMLERKAFFDRLKCFDARDLQSRPNPTQQRVFDDINKYSERYIIAGNQTGKSQLGAREAAWIFSGTHPTWNPPDRPLLMLVVGQSNKVVKEELWESKIKPFLDEGTYKEKIVGGALSGVVHNNGNRILFFSHNSPEECRKLVQGYVADWVWLDEMPGSFRLLAELHTRCQANKAPFLATFTPLLKNAEIKNYIESKNNKFIKKYTMTVHDNPIYTRDKDKYDKLKMRLSSMSESERATREAGAWYVGDNAVYDFSTEKHVEKPEHYDKSWRHIETVDPAASGKAGYALLAEDPNTGTWYVIKADYIKGKAPSVLLQEVMTKTGNVNLVKRVCDSHEAWYIKEANLHKIWYEIPHKKTERKKELIKGLQESLYSGRLRVSPWCDKTIDEFTTCQWSENGSDRIINSSSFHILDCLQYAVDCLPKLQEEKQELTRRQEMKRQDAARRAREASISKALEKRPHRLILKRSRRQSRIWGR